MINNFHEVIPGLLYRGAAPSKIDVFILKEYGIKSIVSLDRESGEKISDLCKKLNIIQKKYYLDHSKMSLFNLLSSDIEKVVFGDCPTFIHCKFGSDRTGLLIAIIKCKFFNVKPEGAIKEAKLFGFGRRLDQKTTNLYVKIIKNCKFKKDNNKAEDIVNNTRDYIDDSRSSALDFADRKSFAPYLDKTRQYPYDNVYNYLYDQEPSRGNMEVNLEGVTPDLDMPLVGLYDNMSGMKGVGPVEIGNGFLIL